MRKYFKIAALLLFVAFIGIKAYRRFTPPEYPGSETVLSDGQGNRFNLAQAKEDYILVSYFQSWCGDCIRELPSMVNLQKEVGTDKIRLVFISDEDWTKINAFQKHAKLAVAYYQSTKTMGELGIYVYPSTFLLGPDRKVLLLKRERFDWNSAEVHSLLK